MLDCYNSLARTGLPRLNSLIMTVCVEWDTLCVEFMEGYEGVIMGMR